MKSVLLIDDHPVVAVGLGLALKQSKELKLVGTVADPATCMSKVDVHQPDALVIDLVFAGVIQTSLISRCRTVLPEAAIIVFSSLPDALYARQATTAGADAYLNKSADMSVLTQLLADLIARPPIRANSGERPGGHDDPAPPRRVLDSVHLTRREIEIARHVGRGLSIGEIALELGVSANTAAVHRDNLRKKLDCRDTKDLVARLARMAGDDGD